MPRRLNPGMNFERLSGPAAERAWAREERLRNNYQKLLRERRAQEQEGLRSFIAWDGEGPTDAGYALFREQRGIQVEKALSFFQGMFGIDTGYRGSEPESNTRIIRI